MMSFIQDLKEKGYAIVENALNSDEVVEARKYFDEWHNSHQKIKAIHDKISPHGIFKHWQIGQQRHAWYVRTRPKVQEVFEEIWETDDLVVSYDGCCYIPADCKKKDTVWTHSDQAPSKKGQICVQGFASLTDNTQRSLVVYEGSHLLHEEYCKERNLTSSKDWFLIDEEYLKKIEDKKRVLPVKAGSLVLWDSRTFHQNQYGDANCNEERIVQYVSFLPRKNLTKKMQEKRINYFLDLRTTSHWAYPVKVNGLQPQAYGNKDLVINYDELKLPYLDDMLDDIYKII